MFALYPPVYKGQKNFVAAKSKMQTETPNCYITTFRNCDTSLRQKAKYWSVLNYCVTGPYYCFLSYQKNPILFIYSVILSLITHLFCHFDSFIVSLLLGYLFLQIYLYIWRVLIGIRNFVKCSPEVLRDSVDDYFDGTRAEFYICTDRERISLLGCVAIEKKSEQGLLQIDDQFKSFFS